MPITTLAKNHMLQNIIEDDLSGLALSYSTGAGGQGTPVEANFAVASNGRRVLSFSVELSVPVSGTPVTINKILIGSYYTDDMSDFMLLGEVDIATQTFDYSGILTVVSNSTYFELTEV